MGFKVTLRKNGQTVGQAHYPAEAVAVGMAQKLNGAASGVEATVERCNGACGAKSNPRRRRNGTTGTTFWQAPSREATMRGIETGDIPGPFSLHAAGGYPSVDDARGRTVASFPTGALKAAQLFVSRANALTPRRRNGTTAANIAASRSLARSRNSGTIDAYVPAYLGLPRHGGSVILAHHPSDKMPTVVGIGTAPTAFQRAQYAGCKFSVVPSSSVKAHRIGG